MTVFEFCLTLSLHSPNKISVCKRIDHVLQVSCTARTWVEVLRCYFWLRGRDRWGDCVPHRGLFYPSYTKAWEAPGSSEAEKTFGQSLVSGFELLIQPSVDERIQCGVGVNKACHQSGVKIRNSFLFESCWKNADEEWNPTQVKHTNDNRYN